MQEGLIDSLVRELKDLDEELLYAGLAVVAKDYEEYLANNPRSDAAVFEEIYSNIIREEKIHFPISPYYLPSKETNLPMGMANFMIEKKLNLVPLGDINIIHEWTRGPGKKLLEKFAEKFKETICDKGGPYEQFKDGLIGQESLPVVIASSILTAGFTATAFWIPITVYISLLLIKTGLKVYCE